MTKTVAVFGAGPALGLSVARRFAGEGYQVALVARDPEKIADLEERLRSDGVTVAGFRAELTDLEQLRAAVEAITARFGLPDVVLYAPGDVSRLPIAALDLDAEELSTWLPLNLLSPVALVRSLLPAMLERGSGALLFAQGVSARLPMPALASVGASQGALLNYLHAVAEEARPRGVHIGSVLIGALIEGSAAQRLWDSGRFEGVSVGDIPRVAPEVLAQRYWDMALDGARVEEIVGA